MEDKLTPPNGVVHDVSEPYAVALERQLSQWDAEIEHLDAQTDLLLANLEDGYYRLLRSLRDKEKSAREALRGVKEEDGGVCEAVKSGGGGVKTAGASQELRLRLVKAFEDLALALDGADRQFSEIYCEVGDRYVPRPPSLTARSALSPSQAAGASPHAR